MSESRASDRPADSEIDSAVDSATGPGAASNLDPERPIGVFDSGVGGLTVVAALRRRLPATPIVFLGDTARLPYGTKSADTVRRYSLRNVDFLERQGVSAVVVACNTASALALPHVESALPLWGVVEPGARRAAEVARAKVGILGTEATILSDAYRLALERLRPELEVTSRACPLFVPLVEEGWLDDPVTETVARRYLEPLLEAGVDTVVLGCTHYPLLAPILTGILGDGIALVDSAEVTAETVARALGAKTAEAPPAGERSSDRFCVTDSAARFGVLAERILGPGAVRLEHVDL